MSIVFIVENRRASGDRALETERLSTEIDIQTSPSQVGLRAQLQLPDRGGVQDRFGRVHRVMRTGAACPA